MGYAGWTMARLSHSMNFIALSERKPVLVVETSWPQAGRKRDLPGTPEFPLTPDGQAQFYEALIRAVQAVPGGMGLGVVPWDQDPLNWDSVFYAKGDALPAMRVLGQTQTPLDRKTWKITQCCYECVPGGIELCGLRPGKAD